MGAFTKCGMKKKIPTIMAFSVVYEKVFDLLKALFSGVFKTDPHFVNAPCPPSYGDLKTTV